MTALPIRALLFFSVVMLLLGGCTEISVSPEVSGEALSIGVTASIVLRRMLTDGTWPQKFRLPDPAKSILAAVLAGVAAMLMAKAQGASWGAAEMAGFSGVPAIILGIVEQWLPQTASSSTSTTTNSSSATTSVPPKA